MRQVAAQILDLHDSTMLLDRLDNVLCYLTRVKAVRTLAGDGLEQSSVRRPLDALAHRLELPFMRKDLGEETVLEKQARECRLSQEVLLSDWKAQLTVIRKDSLYEAS